MTPTGIVAATSSQPRRAYVSSARISRITSDRPMPLTTSIQSRRKNSRSTIAVAR